MKPTNIRVCLVEDDDGLRQRLRELVDTLPGYQCVGAYATAEQALQELPQACPRLLLTDINLPGLNGVELVTQLRDVLPDTEIIMLTVYDDTELIFRSLSAGAGGYLLKPVKRAQLLEAMSDILQGGAPMSSSIARRVVQTFRKPVQTSAIDGDLSTLSTREREILEYLSRGLLLKEIAMELNISHATIQTHIGRIYKKLHVHSRAQAVAKLHQRS
jgi:DNA-binding NarL/FixJ family response regulator